MFPSNKMAFIFIFVTSKLKWKGRLRSTYLLLITHVIFMMQIESFPWDYLSECIEEFQIWSNGLYESTLHRVINNSKYRVSVAFFYEVCSSDFQHNKFSVTSIFISLFREQPNFDASIEPFEFCKQQTGGMAKFDKAVYGEHLVNKVLTNFVY